MILGLNREEQGLQAPEHTKGIDIGENRACRLLNIKKEYKNAEADGSGPNKKTSGGA